MLGTKRVLVTGASGFIGYHVCQNLLSKGVEVLGIDNFSPYYDIKLKEDRTQLLKKFTNYKFQLCDITNLDNFAASYAKFLPDTVIHLAAQPGVRYSVERPDVYVNANLIGTFHVLDVCRRYPPKHLLFASTSAVYGANQERPFKEIDTTRLPLSLYAATKEGGEQMAHCYSHLFKIPITVFRFFTVYGPWVRPDMALFKFTKAMISGEPILIYNNGEMKRDFTYVEDLVEVISRLIEIVPKNKPVPRDSLSPVAPYRIVNIGKGKAISLMDYVAELEEALGLKAKKEFLPLQKGDLVETSASPELLHNLIGTFPETSLKVGINKFVTWYRDYYGS